MVNGELFVGWCIKNAENKKKVFFPRGTFGQGYVIPTENEYRVLVRQISAGNLCLVPVFILVISYIPGFLSFIVFVLLLLAFMGVFSLKVKGWEQSDIKLTYGDGRAANKGKGFGFFLFAVWWLSVYALIIGVIGLVFGELGPRITAILLIAPSLLCFVLWKVLTRA